MRVLAQTIEGEPQRPQFGLGQILELDRRQLVEAQLPGSQHKAPPRDHAPAGVDQDRQNETEFLQTCCQLSYLLGRVPAGVPSERFAIRDRIKLRRQVA